MEMQDKFGRYIKGNIPFMTGKHHSIDSNYKVLRFWESDIENNLNNVIKTIVNTIGDISE